MSFVGVSSIAQVQTLKSEIMPGQPWSPPNVPPPEIAGLMDQGLWFPLFRFRGYVARGENPGWPAMIKLKRAILLHRQGSGFLGSPKFNGVIYITPIKNRKSMGFTGVNWTYFYRSYFTPFITGYCAEVLPRTDCLGAQSIPNLNISKMNDKSETKIFKSPKKLQHTPWNIHCHV